MGNSMGFPKGADLRARSQNASSSLPMNVRCLLGPQLTVQSHGQRPLSQGGVVKPHLDGLPGSHIDAGSGISGLWLSWLSTGPKLSFSSGHPNYRDRIAKELYTMSC